MSYETRFREDEMARMLALIHYSVIAEMEERGELAKSIQRITERGHPGNGVERTHSRAVHGWWQRKHHVTNIHTSTGQSG